MSPSRPPAADPLKVRALASHLRDKPLTYDDLASLPDLGLERRMLQEYLGRHLPEAGYPVQMGKRGRQTTFTLAAQGPLDHKVVEVAMKALARGVLKGLFPIEGTDLDDPGQAPVLAFAAGVPRLEERHQRVLMRWIRASSQRTPRAHMLRYRAAGRREDEPEERLVWPVGVSLREGRRVYLHGIQEPAQSMDEARNYALERVAFGDDGQALREAAGVHQVVPPWMVQRRPSVSDFVAAPFGLVRKQKSATMVRVVVKCDAQQWVFLQGRDWGAGQRERALGGGWFELQFGPVALEEALGWCGQWWRGVVVVGDERLRAEWEKSLRERLRAQEG